MQPVELLKAFADTTRLRILHLLARRGPELCVCDLVSTLELPQGTVSRHLMQLRQQGIVCDRREGVWMHYSLSDPGSPLHRTLLKCLKSCFEDEPVLLEDLARFDSLHAAESLACCAPNQQPPPSAFQILNRIRKPGKAGAR